MIYQIKHLLQSSNYFDRNSLSPLKGRRPQLRRDPGVQKKKHEKRIYGATYRFSANYSDFSAIFKEKKNHRKTIENKNVVRACCVQYPLNHGSFFQKSKIPIFDEI